ncbi:hypothetical protein [Microbacterium sp. NPDC087592]|uniref:hypothetical protein n=1 Tax=Microbacterium sp. NPDC087592 TaxID=3364193 RepID=UPI0038087A5B
MAPHWEDDDASECVVAFEPRVFPDPNLNQLERFIEGARQRGEIALVVSSMRGSDESDGDDVVNIFSAGGAEYVDAWDTQILSRPLGARSRIRPAGGMTAADRDLALRLLNYELDWRILELHGREEHTQYGMQDYSPAGYLEPILVTALGEPVVAAWVSPNEVERRYIVPADVEWVVIAEWVRDKALPALNIQAVQRFRPEEAVPDALRTTRELVCAAKISELDAEYATARAVLDAEQAEATADASEVRELLLYSRGTDLETGVARVLRDAGVKVTELDKLIGTQSADLLTVWQGRRRLVEVKSAGGAAGEDLYGQLRKHLDAWAAARREPVESGALVVSHGLRIPPTQRDRKVYTRPEFFRSLEHPVVSALDLFDAWRGGDWDRVREMFFPATVGEETRHVDESKRQRWPWSRWDSGTEEKS